MTKEGKVTSLAQPQGSGFTLKDILPSDYRASDAARDAIIVALAVKVWGVPHISLSLPHIALNLPSISLSLPHISVSSTLVKIL